MKAPDSSESAPAENCVRLQETQRWHPMLARIGAPPSSWLGTARVTATQRTAALQLRRAALGFALLLACGTLVGCGLLASDPEPVGQVPTAPVESTPLPQRCMVSKEPLDGTTALSYVHQGQTYYFCSLECITLFKSDPARYLKQFARDRRSS